MTYGISVLNDSGRLLLDATYPMFYPTTTSPETSSTGAYPTGLATGDLVVGRMATGTSGGPTRFAFPSSDPYLYYILRQSGVVTTPSSGFGALVRDGAGATVFASSNQNKMLVIATCGVISGSTGISFPATGTVPDLDKYYVVVNNTLKNVIGASGALSGYQYNWTSGTEGYIGINNLTFSGTTVTPRVQQFPYMIFKELG